MYRAWLCAIKMAVLNQLLQLGYHRINFFAGVVLAKAKPHGYLIGIVIDGTDNMATRIGAAGAGTTAAGANVIDVEIEKYHLTLFCFGKAYVEHGVQAMSGRVAVEMNAFYMFAQLLHHVHF